MEGRQDIISIPQVELIFDGKVFTMDAEARVSVISKFIFEKNYHNPLQEPSVRLKLYDNSIIKPVGQVILMLLIKVIFLNYCFIIVNNSLGSL